MPRRSDYFAAGVKRVLTLAPEEARQGYLSHVGTGHLLLALIQVDGLAAHILTGAGATPEDLRTAVDGLVGRGLEPPAEIDLTPRARRSVEIAIELARRSAAPRVETEHLLLGVLTDGGIATQALQSLGVDPDAVRAAAAGSSSAGDG